MNNLQQDKYLKRKIGDIEGSVSVVCGVANMTGCMFGKNGRLNVILYQIKYLSMVENIV